MFDKIHQNPVLICYVNCYAKTEAQTYMPKIARILKKLEIDKIKAEGLHAVGGVSCLHLQIKRNSRSWILYT